MTILSWDEFSGGKGNEVFRDKTAVTIGVFDGVHRGHQVLLQKVIASGYEPVVVTFKNHPRSVVAHRKAPRLLITVEERLAIFEKRGVSAAILIDFSQKFSILSGRVFLETVWKNASPAYMVIGSTFRCGYRGGFDAAEVARVNAEAGVRTEIVEPVREGDLPVSSSRIREALAAGDVALAERMLGRGGVTLC
ncbi:MAG: FAD synthetase family protein [Spirochaetaceae bacterium]|jgi:riboflavin kinase/FMN adenylyltransferase|nr:FAD synthetase family protein [Spirochaetaceae bacterium]